MATTTLQQPSHEHPLETLDFSGEYSPRPCELCRREISAHAYTCRDCDSYFHRVCAEAPPQIERHPLHPDHPLTLLHHRLLFKCNPCGQFFESGVSLFRCDKCDFDLDISCAFSTLSDQEGSQAGTTPEQITLLRHPHPLTSFSTRHDFVGNSDCVVCLAPVKGDGYMCLHRQCEFLIHKGCIQDLYYEDGTKAPRVFHDHRLETFVGEGTGSIRCAKCRSDDRSGEFLGCAECEVFIHRDCIQLPEILQYPPHPDHTLVLFIYSPDDHKLRCGFCSGSFEGELGYRCTSCEFFVHVRCTPYCEEGMNVEIKLSWHEHPLFLYHRTEDNLNYCSYCEDQSIGPTYACKEKNCGFLLHKHCIKMEPTIIHPYDPDHPLILGGGDGWRLCIACHQIIFGLNFSCQPCKLYLHVKCATLVPTRKHYLHEHELLCMDKISSFDCNRCGASIDSPFFRCGLCDFNLHEKCMEVPRVVNNKIHWHPLTLHESYVDDDSGEYYCDHCETRRDGRLGVYVCGQCSARWAFHMECALPELQKMYAKEGKTGPMEILVKDIAQREREIHAVERKLDEMKRELDERKKKLEALTLE